MDDQLRRAIELAQAGQRAEARALLRDFLAAQPNLSEAWLWLASVAASQEERVEALQKVLTLDPANRQARTALTQLGFEVPPLPSEQPGFAARRLSPVELYGLGVVLIIVLGIVVFAISQWVGGDDTPPTPTPTNTATATMTLPPTVTLTPSVTNTPGPSPTPYVAPTLAPTWTPAPTNTLRPTRTAAPTSTPLPTRTLPPSNTPEVPTATPLPPSTDTPEPTSTFTATPLPSDTPEPTNTPRPTRTRTSTSSPTPEG